MRGTFLAAAIVFALIALAAWHLLPSDALASQTDAASAPSRRIAISGGCQFVACSGALDRYNGCMPRKRDPLEKVDNLPARRAKYAPIAASLTQVYGTLDWSRNQDGMDELISCILSQSTNDVNRDRAFARLKESFPDWEAVRFADLAELTDVIRPAGLANQKAPRIQNVLGIIFDEVGAYSIDFLDDLPIDEAKAWLNARCGAWGPKPRPSSCVSPMAGPPFRSIRTSIASASASASCPRNSPPMTRIRSWRPSRRPMTIINFTSS